MHKDLPGQALVTLRVAMVVLKDIARFTFSAEFRRNSGKNFVSASYREEKFRYFSVNFVSKFKNSKQIVKKYEKNMIKN